jgi:hypothetical protein
MTSSIPAWLGFLLWGGIVIAQYAAWELGTHGLGLIERRRRRTGSAMLLTSCLMVVGPVFAGATIAQHFAHPAHAAGGTQPTPYQP